MRGIFISSLLLCASTFSLAQSNPVPAAKIDRMLKAYAASIGCNYSFNRKDAVELDLDKDGSKEFVALYYLDPGCAGGSGTTGAALAVLKEETEEKLYVIPAMSEPAAQAFGLSRFIDRLFVKDGQLWFAGKVHGKDDGNNFPSIPVQSQVQLIKLEVPVDAKNKHTVYYWKSTKDFWNY